MHTLTCILLCLAREQIYLPQEITNNIVSFIFIGKPYLNPREQQELEQKLLGAKKRYQANLKLLGILQETLFDDLSKKEKKVMKRTQTKLDDVIREIKLLEHDLSASICSYDFCNSICPDYTPFCFTCAVGLLKLPDKIISKPPDYVKRTIDQLIDTDDRNYVQTKERKELKRRNRINAKTRVKLEPVMATILAHRDQIQAKLDLAYTLSFPIDVGILQGVTMEIFMSKRLENMRICMVMDWIIPKGQYTPAIFEIDRCLELNKIPIEIRIKIITLAVDDDALERLYNLRRHW